MCQSFAKPDGGVLHCTDFYEVSTKNTKLTHHKEYCVEADQPWPSFKKAYENTLRARDYYDNVMLAVLVAMEVTRL